MEEERRKKNKTVWSILPSSENAKPLSILHFSRPFFLHWPPFHIRKSRLTTVSLTFDHVYRSFFSLSSLITSPRRSSNSLLLTPPIHSIPLVLLSLSSSFSSSSFHFLFFCHTHTSSLVQQTPVAACHLTNSRERELSLTTTSTRRSNIRSDKKDKQDARLVHHPGPACHRIPIHHQGRPLLLREGTATFSTAKTQQQAELNQATTRT